MTTWPNWVDLVVIIILLRTCYSGYNRGFLGALLNLIGVVSMTSLSINYSPTLSRWLEPWLRVNPILAASLVFWGLFVVLLLSVQVVLKYLTEIVKWERLHWLIQSFGAILGGLRGIWWSGFIVLALSSSGWPYLRESVESHSVLGPRLVSLARVNLERVADFFPGAQDHGKALIPPARAEAR